MRDLVPGTLYVSPEDGELLIEISRKDSETEEEHGAILLRSDDYQYALPSIIFKRFQVDDVEVIDFGTDWIFEALGSPTYTPGQDRPIGCLGVGKGGFALHLDAHSGATTLKSRTMVRFYLNPPTHAGSAQFDTLFDRWCIWLSDADRARAGGEPFFEYQATSR